MTKSNANIICGAYEQPSPDIWYLDEKARRDAMEAIARDIPDPKRIAFDLASCEIEALYRATRGQDGMFRLLRDDRSSHAGNELFSRGIVEARGPYLTGFGHRVRKAVLEEFDG